MKIKLSFDFFMLYPGFNTNSRESTKSCPDVDLWQWFTILKNYILDADNICLHCGNFSSCRTKKTAAFINPFSGGCIWPGMAFKFEKNWFSNYSPIRINAAFLLHRAFPLFSDAGFVSAKISLTKIQIGKCTIWQHVHTVWQDEAFVWNSVRSWLGCRHEICRANWFLSE